MRSTRWLLAIPLALAATLGSARASSVRDQAHMFSPDAVRRAEADLNRIERTFQLPATIETIDSLDGQRIDDAARRRAERSGAQGLYVLISKADTKLDVISARAFRRAMNEARLKNIEKAFVAGFKKGDFDAGLLEGVQAIATEAAAAQSELGSLRTANAPAPGRPFAAPARRGNPNGSFGIGSLLGLGLLILAVLFIVRLVGALFNRGSGYAQPMGGRMGGPGYGPGYGGGGGGFMSGLFGGLGGALAGNWLYDQFSGRHHGGDYTGGATYGESNADTGASDWSGGADAGGADWSGGADGGGDWGGGGGGADWGGGGDWVVAAEETAEAGESRPQAVKRSGALARVAVRRQPGPVCAPERSDVFDLDVPVPAILAVVLEP